MLGPVSSSTRWSGERSQSFGTNCAWPASAASTTGWRPARTRNASSSVTCGRHQVPTSASFAADWMTSSRASASAQAASASACSSAVCTRCANTARSRAAARSPASAMRRSRSDSSGVVKRAPLAMPWRSVSSGKSRSFSDRGGRRLDDVAELGVVADLQAGDAVALRVVELQRGQHAAAVVAQRAFGIEFGVEARQDGVAVVQPVRRRVGQRGGQRLFERWIDVQGGAGRLQQRRQRVPKCDPARGRGWGEGGRALTAPSPNPLPQGEGESRLLQRRQLRRLARRAQPVAHRRQIARAAPAHRQPPQRPRDVRRGPQRRPQPRRRPRARASIHAHASCRAAIAAGSVSGAASHPASSRAPAGVSVRCTVAEQRVQRAAIARPVDLQAGARRRVHRQQPGLPCGAGRASRGSVPAWVART